MMESRKMILRFLKSSINLLLERNNVLSLFFIIFAAAIILSTSILQFGASGDILSETMITGDSREQTVKAQRGDIYDRYGIPLAVTENINVISVCEAGLDSDELNSMLLDLTRYFEANNIDFTDPLKDYISVDPVKFNKSLEEILFWQTNRNTFGLKNLPEAPSLYTDKIYVKTDPEEFFKYMKITLFGIDEKLSDKDSYNIMRIRYAIYLERWAFQNGKPVEISRRVPDLSIHFIEEQNFRFTGVLSSSEYERKYLPDAVYISHILGYMGAISSSEFNELKDSGYTMNDKVGKSGVERFAERYLRGIDGKTPYNILTKREDNEVFYPYDSGRSAVSGSDVKLTIDMDLQKTAYRALQENIEFIKSNPKDKNKGDADSGAVVMLKVETGEVLAMVSFPGFDPNDFILAPYDKESNDRMADVLTNTKDKPMLNRAIMEIYAPGSTFKPITAISALEEGVNTNQYCHGTEIIGEWRFKCLEYPSRGHGLLDLTRGLATSCNIYFHKLGVETGINNIDKWMKAFGLGEYTGIDLPGEERGHRSNRETKKLMRQSVYDQLWLPADTAQTAIGQFENKYTITQLARYTAALATGELVTPHVIKEITRKDGSVLVSENINKSTVGVSDDTLLAVKEGMIAVSQDRQGTARKVFGDFPIKIACKTGTAETGHEDRSSSNALFICYAPADDPEVAIAQIVEKGVWGSNTMGIARDLLIEYFGLGSDSELEFEDPVILY